MHPLPPEFRNLRQQWPLPSVPLPIVCLGAGGIVNDAHLPAYAKGDLAVQGIYDVDSSRARRTAERFDLPQVYPSLEAAVAGGDCCFDVAVPPDAIDGVLQSLPDSAAVLIQKPMGLDLRHATRILDICREKNLTAAVNFQLRFSPLMLALRDIIERGLLGKELLECEVWVNCHMPWELWPFLESLERMEINLHSIHYLDMVRSFLGEPKTVFARTLQHPAASKLASSRTSAILDYGPVARCCLSIHHHHRYGRRFQVSQFRCEGETGAAIAKMGTNLNYPKGEPDSLQVATREYDWLDIPLTGNWFPDAFLGTMSNLQRFHRGEDDQLQTSVEDAWWTMKLVEDCYQSQESD